MIKEKSTEQLVSVPSRGILFPNDAGEFIKKRDESVSVPSRGILFPNCLITLMLLSVTGFRPLSGYLISKFENRKYYEATVDFRFRPLSGYLISK